MEYVLLHINENKKVHEIPSKEFDYLAEFVRSVKRNNGKDFEPSSFTEDDHMVENVLIVYIL